MGDYPTALLVTAYWFRDIHGAGRGETLGPWTGSCGAPVVHLHVAVDLLAVFEVASIRSLPRRDTPAATHDRRGGETIHRHTQHRSGTCSPCTHTRRSDRRATRELLAELLTYPGVPAKWRTPDTTAASTPVLPLVLRRGGITARFFTTIATPGTPLDVTMQELRVESFFPADDATEELARRLTAAG